MLETWRLEKSEGGNCLKRDRQEGKPLKPLPVLFLFGVLRCGVIP